MKISGRGGVGILCAFRQKKQPWRERKNLNVQIIGWRLENGGREGGRRWRLVESELSGP